MVLTQPEQRINRCPRQGQRPSSRPRAQSSTQYPNFRIVRLACSEDVESRRLSDTSLVYQSNQDATRLPRVEGVLRLSCLSQTLPGFDIVRTQIKVYDSKTDLPSKCQHLIKYWKMTAKAVSDQRLTVFSGRKMLVTP
jgi:hypothetical protein